MRVKNKTIAAVLVVVALLVALALSMRGEDGLMRRLGTAIHGQ
jgi:hypothetical protein